MIYRVSYSFLPFSTCSSCHYKSDSFLPFCTRSSFHSAHVAAAIISQAASFHSAHAAAAIIRQTASFHSAHAAAAIISQAASFHSAHVAAAIISQTASFHSAHAAAAHYKSGSFNMHGPYMRSVCKFIVRSSWQWHAYPGTPVSTKMCTHAGSPAGISGSVVVLWSHFPTPPKKTSFLHGFAN